MEPLTKEAILLLNNGSVSFEQARASLNVDLTTFKARLEELNIFTWKEVDGSLVRIHGRDYQINIMIKGMGKKSYAVKDKDAFEDVIRMLEKELKLSPGCYKLSYRHPRRSKGYIWVKTDCDWHYAVRIASLQAYFVFLHLEVFPSNQTVDGDACDEDACDEDACDEDACDEDASDEDAYYEDASDEDFSDEAAYYEDNEDGFYIDDLDEYASDEDVDVEDDYVEDACDENSMEPFTKEAVLLLNNGSVSFEQARALLNVDLSTFKARLEKLNIFTWKEVNGSLVRIHAGDYEITIMIKFRGMLYVVNSTDSFEYVIHMIEADLKESLNLSPGCYKLTYKHPKKSIGNVWLKTDRDWHFAVLLSKARGYHVLLYLEVFPSSQTADKDALNELL